MNLRKLSFKTTTPLFLIIAAVLLSSFMVYAEDRCRIIRIDEGAAGGGSRLEIFPQKTTVPVGTCTVWYNSVKRQVQVSFREDAKKCMLATESPAGFDELELKDGESCYISHKLARGKTASLYWVEPGTYRYTLETLALSSTGNEFSVGKKIAEGIIEVE